MKIIKTPLSGVLVFEPRVFGDPRGFFVETWEQSRYQQAGIDSIFVQDNHSRSSKGVLRGLHFQLEHPQGKLVRAGRGTIFDVALDIRAGSPTFGQWYGIELSDENHRQMWIPPGLAHGFCVLSETADFLYKCTATYCPDCEAGIAWDDSELDIAWPVEQPLLSEKDQQYCRLSEMAESQLPKWQDG